MGCTSSKSLPSIKPSSSATSSPTIYEKKVNNEIDAKLKKDRMNLTREVKVLLLGAGEFGIACGQHIFSLQALNHGSTSFIHKGESGKSTVVKQMRLIYRATYTSVEREAFREVVFANTVQSMEAVLQGFQQLGLELPPSLAAHSKTVLTVDQDELVWSSGQLDPSITSAIAALWQHPAVKRVVAMAHKFQLNDSAAYFFDEIARTGARGYLPTDNDILRTRVRSTGIVEEHFDINGFHVRVIDVGGQRSERKKWIHCFEGVGVLLFVVACSEFDQTLREEQNVNRLAEAIMLFESIVNSRWFRDSCFVLLLNKTDLFAKKLRSGEASFSQSFPEYTGADDDVQAAQGFLKQHFLGLDKRRSERRIYAHFSTATETSQVKVVCAAIFDTVLTQALQGAGLL